MIRNMESLGHSPPAGPSSTPDSPVEAPETAADPAPVRRPRPRQAPPLAWVAAAFAGLLVVVACAGLRSVPESYLALAVLGAAAAAAAAAWFFFRRLMLPVRDFRFVLQRLSRGELDVYPGDPGLRELRGLAEDISALRDSLRQPSDSAWEAARERHNEEFVAAACRAVLPGGPHTSGRFTLRAERPDGGGFFDFAQRSDGQVAFALAPLYGLDGETWFASRTLSALFRAHARTHRSPGALHKALCARLKELLPGGGPAALACGFLDPQTGRVAYASIGPDRPVVIRFASGSPEPLANAEVELKPGDVMLCAAGLSESESADSSGTSEPRVWPAVLLVEVRAPEPVAEDAAPPALESARSEPVEAAGGGAEAPAALQLPAEFLADLLPGLDFAPAGDEPAPDLPASLREPAFTPVSDSRLEPLVCVPMRHADAVDLLEEAETLGRCLRWSSKIDGVKGVQDWLVRVPVLRDLEAKEGMWLASALHEVCERVAAQGAPGEGPPAFEVWWLPPRGPQSPGDTPAPAFADQTLRHGRFVVRDDSLPLDPDVWTGPAAGAPPDLTTVRRVMREVHYAASTPRGNVLVLHFGPRRELGGEGERAQAA